MVVNEDRFKAVVKEFMEGRGFRYSPIPERKDLTPDFQLFVDDEEYTVELKFKGLSPEENKACSDASSEKGGDEKAFPMAYRNSFASSFEEGKRQIEAFDPERRSFRLLWLHATGTFSRAIYHNLRSTIFGTETFMSRDFDYTLTCYFFHESLFFTHKDIDGTIITNDDEDLQLCVNPYSKRYNDFIECKLCESFSDALCDPQKLKSEPNVLVADCSIPRRKMDKVIEYLQKKYEISHLERFPMTFYQFTSSIKQPQT